MIFIAFLHGAQHDKGSVINSASSLVVFVKKTFIGIRPSLCHKQVAGSSSLSTGWPSLAEDEQTQQEDN